MSNVGHKLNTQNETIMFHDLRNRVGFTSSRNEPVYLNSTGIMDIDTVDSLLIRRSRAVQVRNNCVGNNFSEYFLPTPHYDKIENEIKNDTRLSGIIVPNTEKPAAWSDYNIYTSTASHHEIFGFINGKPPEQWPDPRVTTFGLTYVTDKFTHKKLVIANYSIQADSSEKLKLEAILRIIAPPYYTSIKEDKIYFEHNRFI